MKTKMIAVSALVAALVVVPSTGFIPEQSRDAAEALGSGIDYAFCGVGYIKWDASRVNATGRTKLDKGFTYREYERSMPGGFGHGMGWTTQWNKCYKLIGHGPNYPTKKNFMADSFSPKR